MGRAGAAAGRLRAAIGALLVLATVLTLGRIVGHPFMAMDDNQLVTWNPHVAAGLTWDGVRWAFANATERSFWHPLTWLSHMLDVELFGLDPRGHHLTALLLHAADALLLFLVLCRLTGAAWRSAFAAALFALHPLHLESVAWVAERKDVLSAFFGLLALWGYARYAERPGAGRMALTAVAFALGLMAKPMLVTLPFAMLLLDFWPLGRLRAAPGAGARRKDGPGPAGLGRLLAEKAPLFLLSAASVAATLAYDRGGGGWIRSGDEFPLPVRLANAAVSYALYLGRTVWPSSLAVYYPHPGPGIPLAEWLGCLLLLAALTALAILAARRAPGVAVGWLWFLGTLVPVIGIVQAGEQRMADRFTYLPLVGLFVAAAWGLPELAARLRLGARALALAGVAALAALAAASFGQAGYWADDVTLFRRAVAVTGDNWVARVNLGWALEQRGSLEEAVAEYREALRIRPGAASVHNNLGNALGRLGRVDEAIERFREALRISPDYAFAHGNLGWYLERRGDVGQAIGHYREALRLDSGDVGTRCNLGFLLARRGEIAEAAFHLREAVRLRPADGRLRAAVDAALSGR